MRVRVLILVLLLAAWLVPASGAACPSDAREGAGHAHGRADAGGPGNDHPGQGPEAAHSHAAEAPAGSGSHSLPGEPICCSRVADLPAVPAVVQDAKPRPKPAISVPAAGFAVTPPSAGSVSQVDLRRREPSQLPYAQTRRPLLI